MSSENGKWQDIWERQKQRILLTVGILIITASFINSEVFGNTFHSEFLWVGLALCGVGIAQLDKFAMRR